MPAPLKLFISYADKDEAYLEDFQTYLVSLKRQKLIKTWTNKDISLGEVRDDEIRINLQNSDIVAFLVSPDFMASDYIYEKEILIAIEEYKKGNNKIIPIVIRTCEFGQSEINQFQALPQNAKPISTWKNQDEAWTDVSKQLRALINNLLEKKSESHHTGIEIPTEDISHPPSSTQSTSGIDKAALKIKLRNDEIEAVMEELLTYTANTEEDKHNTIIMLSSQYKSNQKNARLGVISREDTGINNARITNALLEIIKEL